MSLYMIMYCILDVWTCIWVSELELVFWVSDLVFGCVTLYLKCLDLYSGYCIPVGCLYTCMM